MPAVQGFRGFFSALHAPRLLFLAAFVFLQKGRSEITSFRELAIVGTVWLVAATISTSNQLSSGDQSSSCCSHVQCPQEPRQHFREHGAALYGAAGAPISPERQQRGPIHRRSAEPQIAAAVLSRAEVEF